MSAEIVRDADATFTDLERAMVQEARAQVVCLPLCRPVSLNNPTLAINISKHPTTADASAITDGTGMSSNTGINPTSVTLTAAAVGLLGVVTDQSATGSLLDVPEAAANFGRALANKIEVDIATLYQSLDTQVGTAATNLTQGVVVTALYTLENANENSNIVGVLAPVQIRDLRNDIIASGGSAYASSATSPVGDGFLMANKPERSSVGTLFGIPLWQSSNVPTVSSNKRGGIFNAGRAFGFAWKWTPRIETIRVPSMPGTQIAATACYGVVEVVGTAGCDTISTSS